MADMLRYPFHKYIWLNVDAHLNYRHYPIRSVESGIIESDICNNKLVILLLSEAQQRAELREDNIYRKNREIKYERLRYTKFRELIGLLCDIFHAPHPISSMREDFLATLRLRYFNPKIPKTRKVHENHCHSQTFSKTPPNLAKQLCFLLGSYNKYYRYHISSLRNAFTLFYACDYAFVL